MYKMALISKCYFFQQLTNIRPVFTEIRAFVKFDCVCFNKPSKRHQSLYNLTLCNLVFKIRQIVCIARMLGKTDSGSTHEGPLRHIAYTYAVVDCNKVIQFISAMI